jgi:hypothetical protein
MFGRYLTCWNCETSRPAADFADRKCPLCGAKNHLAPIYLFLGVTFLGGCVGWLGGALYGWATWLAGGGTDVQTAASVGTLLCTALFGVVGAGFAIVVAVENASVRRIVDVLARGAEIKRRRAERLAGGRPAAGLPTATPERSESP